MHHPRKSAPLAVADTSGKAAVLSKATVFEFPADEMARYGYGRVHRLARGCASQLSDLRAKNDTNTKPVKINGLPDVYAYPRANGTWDVRIRVRDPNRRNAKTGQRVRHNISIGLDLTAPLMEIAARAKTIKEKVEGGWNPRASATPFRTFIKFEFEPWINGRSRSPKTYVSRYDSIIDSILGDKAVGDITAAEILAWRDSALRGGNGELQRKPGTINRALMLLRVAFRLAVERGYRQDNPAASVAQLKEQVPAPRALDDEELGRIGLALEGAPLYLRLIVRLALSTGMRIGEIVKLRIEDVDLDNSVLRLRMTKSGEPQSVPITPTVRSILSEVSMQQVDGNPHLFPACRSSGAISPPYKALTKLLKEADVKHAGFHVFRKTAATHAMLLGDLLTASRMMRHQSIRTTELHYLATPQARLKQVAGDVGARLQACLQGGVT